MANNEKNLPERTDQIIDGAMETDHTDTLVAERETTKDKVVAKVKETKDKAAHEAAGQARGLVSQGLERGSDTVSNVAKLVGDTATGLDDNLGKEYGDYARKAASYLDETAQSLAAKDPDELIEDTRNFVRKSPGIALAGAAIIGFAVARLIQSGLDAETDRL
ncbi:hypothetical protein [Sphingomicrobium marinum]|uniref:hypothetical protein n=1 Tax=Sphingomicrobium marinum TaxID=1227950 RepID=UPI00223F53C8|nr:hypothetical protein [Sphingomicrobium marinum]